MTLEQRYQTVFAMIVRTQYGQQKSQTADQLRRSFMVQLKDVDDVLSGSRSTYSPDHLEGAKFAVVAFADEAALNCPDVRIRQQWVTPTQKSLSHLLFGETKSGEAFYKRLKKLRDRNSRSPELVDVLEVFCLCLLLGFEGDQKEDREAWIRELVIEITETRGKLASLSLGRSNLSEPTSKVFDKPTRWLHAVSWAVVIMAVICYLVANGQVSGDAGAISRLIQAGAIR